MDREADYGPLNGVSRNRIRADLIRDNWDELLRVAGSLKLGAVTASEFVRTLQAGSRTSKIAAAIAELGRIAKSLSLLSYVDDAAHRRRILVQLNRHEKRHELARKIFHGQSEVRKRYREGQEDQLGALGLVVNAVCLFNSLYLDQAVRHLRADGEEAADEDLARVSPLAHEHVRQRPLPLHPRRVGGRWRLAPPCGTRTSRTSTSSRRPIPANRCSDLLGVQTDP